MKRLIEFFVNNDKLTWIITLMFFIIGVAGAGLIKKEQNPTVDLGMVDIDTIYNGAIGEEIETEITKKIEDELRGIKGIKNITSISQTNRSKIVIKIDIDKYNQDDVVEDIQAALQKVSDLPSDIDSDPVLTEINTEEYAVVKMAILGPNDKRQRDAFAELVADELEDIKDVLEVEKNGYAEREFSVLLDINKMNQFYVGTSEVVSALSGRNVNIPAGNLKSWDNQGIIRMEAKASEIEKLENVLIRSNFNGQKIYLKDIAKVIDGQKEIEVFVKFNGKDATILDVKKKTGSDTINLVKEINEKIENIKEIYGNNEFEIITYYDESVKVQNKFDVIKSNVISGVIIVLIFMLIFLPGKIGLMATLSMPLSLLLMLGLMPFLGINLHTISMMAMVIALGMLVDNSIIVSENFARFRKQGMLSKEAAIESANSLWLPVVATTLTTVCAFVPIFLAKGVMGKFISTIPIVVSLTLIISLVEAFFLLPTRLAFVGGSALKKKTKNKDVNRDDWFDKISNGFESIMKVAVRHRYIVLCLFFLSLFIAGIFFKMNKLILFPSEQVESYNVVYYGKLGDSLEKMSDYTFRLMDSIKKTLGNDAEYIIGYVGRSGALSFTDELQQNHHSAEMVIRMTNEASKRLNHYEVLEKLRSIDTNYLEKISFSEEKKGPPTGRAVEAIFRANDLKDIYKVLNPMKTKLNSIDGIIDIETNDHQSDDEISIKLDFEKIARLGLTSVEIGSAIRASFEGIPITSLTINNKEFDIKVKFDNKFKQTDKDVENITIMDRRGNLIPLKSIAKIERKEGPRVINRRDFKKAITLRANVDETKITALQANTIVQEYFKELQKDNPSVSLVFAGEKESSDESFQSLILASVFAIVGIFAILVFMTNSYVKPLIIMTSIPLGLLGFAMAFYFHHRPISFLALIGVVGLAGIVINVGIVLISFIDTMRKNSTLPLNDILAKSSGMRLRAVSVSTLTTIAGLLPTAYGIGGYEATLIPLTLAMGWGLISGTILSLVWIPCGYGIIEDCNKVLRKTKIGMYFYKKRLKKRIKN